MDRGYKPNRFVRRAAAKPQQRLYHKQEAAKLPWKLDETLGELVALHALCAGLEKKQQNTAAEKENLRRSLNRVNLKISHLEKSLAAEAERLDEEGVKTKSLSASV